MPDTIQLEETTKGIVLPIQAQPRARKNAIVGVHAGRLKVAVTQAPEKGKANAVILKVLASALDLKRSQLTLMTGPTSSHKKFLVTDITADALKNRIASVLA